MPPARAPSGLFVISFLLRMFFREGITPSPFILFSLSLSRRTVLRHLQDTKAPTVCTLDGGIGDDEGNYKYNCEAEADVDSPDEVGDIKVLDDFKFTENKEGTIPAPGLEDVEPAFSPQAAEEAADITEISNAESFATLTGEIKNPTSRKFEIHGTLSGEDQAKNDVMNSKTIEFNFYDESSGELVNKKTICDVINNEEKDFKIRCNPDGTLIGSLHRSSGYVTVNNKTSEVSLDLKENADTVNINSASGNSTNPSRNPTFFRKNSSGLSGGAIAGIVIACAIALIIATVLAMFLKGSKAPTNNNSTVVGLKTFDNYQE